MNVLCITLKDSTDMTNDVKIRPIAGNCIEILPYLTRFTWCIHTDLDTEKYQEKSLQIHVY